MNRSINNNIISAFDEDGNEVIVIGRGIGYKAKGGQSVSADLVQKVFRMSNQSETEHLKVLFANIPPAHIELTDEIFTYAKTTLQKRLNERAFITLADHLSFAVQRFRQGMTFQNLLLGEVKRFYPQEYKIGLYAIELANNRLHIAFPEDEAASIAMHIFNAEYDISVSDVFSATKLLDQIVSMIGEYARLDIQGNAPPCERFLTHLKFLVQRVVKKQHPAQNDEKLSDYISMVQVTYPSEFERACQVARFIEKEHAYTLSGEETTAMAVHIKRISA